MNLVSPSPPAALLGMGITLPSMVNLYYINPEVFIYEVRAYGCDHMGFLHPSSPSSSLPAGTHSGVSGSARPGGVPCSC